MSNSNKAEGNVQELAGTGNTSFELTKEHAKMLQSLVYHNQKMKLEQEAYAEDVKAVASKINVKPNEVKEMVRWLIQEQEKGGVLEANEQKLDMVRQVLSHFDESQAPES